MDSHSAPVCRGADANGARLRDTVGIVPFEQKGELLVDAEDLAFVVRHWWRSGGFQYLYSNKNYNKMDRVAHADPCSWVIVGHVKFHVPVNEKARSSIENGLTRRLLILQSQSASDRVFLFNAVYEAATWAIAEGLPLGRALQEKAISSSDFSRIILGKFCFRTWGSVSLGM